MARFLGRILILVAAGAAASVAHAQRLAYADMLAEEAPPNLAHSAVADGAPGAVRAFYLDRSEWRGQRGGDGYHWDWSAELGGPRHRLWLATTGDGLAGGGLDYFETQALYSRPIGIAELNLQAGLRQDFVPRPRRSYAALGVQGNVTEALYVGAFGYLSHRGELTGRLFAYYDLPVIGRLILQPAFEAEIAGADVPALGIGSGPVYVEGGLRLRYVADEAFAPYIGVNWERLAGRTARMARDSGEDVETTSLVLGARSYF